MPRDAEKGQEQWPIRLGDPIRAHLSLDPEWDQLTVLEFGTVWDGQPDDYCGELESDERICLLLREPKEGPVIGFIVREPHEFDPEAIDEEVLWSGPRFEVPVLGPEDATIGQIILAAQGRFEPGEPTADAMFFQMAISAGHHGDDLEKAAWCFRLALEAGDPKARFGLGYTLVDLEQYREAYEHLRLYAELTPHNAWAWCWFGKACEGLGETREAASAYRRAISLEKEEGSFETDAPELLRALER